MPLGNFIGAYSDSGSGGGKTKRSDDDLADLFGAFGVTSGATSGLTARSRRGRTLTKAKRYSPPRTAARKGTKKKTARKTATKKAATKKAAKKTATQRGVSATRKRKLMKSAIATKDYKKPLARKEQDDLTALLSSWGL
jgi:hypothetical protein